MGTKATRKDFYMEIRKSPGRFISILFIVALGVAFFSGIRASEPSMRITGDAYFDQAGLMDIKAVSTLGITENDIKALEKVEGVARAEGAYSGDFLCDTGEKQYVFHVMTQQGEMNKVTVSDGRLPEQVGECLADDDMGYKVGDIITLKSGTEDPVSDTLKTEEYKVVGTGNSPCYISFGRGMTTIGSGSISGFLVVPEETFALEVYTEAYVQVEGARELVAYTEDYDQKIETVLDAIEEITGERGKIRRQEILDDAGQEIEDARAELEEGRAKAQAELNDAAVKIEDGQAELNDARQKIEDGKTKLSEAKTTLTSRQKELKNAEAQYQDGLKKWQDGKAEYEAGLEQFESRKAEVQVQLKQGEEGLALYRQQLDQKKTEGEAQITWLETKVHDLEEQIRNLEAGTPDPAVLESLKNEVQNLQGTIAAIETGLEQGEAGYKSKEEELRAEKEKAGRGLAAAESQLADSKAVLDANKRKLDSAYSQITSGQSQIDSGWSEISKQESALKSGESEIAENEVKLEDAKREYEEGKQGAEQEIADGEKEIADAEAELEDIEEAKWYVYDRSTLPEHDGYGENADRMRAIGRVFPVIFFLVAALISLTSMTRMVEEQRIQIGTMKALGYSKSAIVSKYLGYALLATAGGSVIGVLIGEKILPYIIIYAYGIMYQHLPEILVPYDWSYAVQASLAAVACTTLATLFSCFRELGEHPASLMRPPAPRIGKRVFLEYIGFIWRRLNFTWKSTVRNLMRYKKRFFMTLFGIGGCMALMVVGYGIKDSVFEIAGIQYAEIQVYDGSIILQENLAEEERRSLEEYLQENGDIERHMDCYMKNITLKNGNHEHGTYITVLGDPGESDEYIHFRDRRSKEVYRLSDEGAIISEKTAKLLDAEAGDSILIRDEDMGDKEVRIQYICENYMGHYMYLTPGYYEKVFGAQPEYNNILFAVSDSYSKAELEEAGEKLLARKEVLSVNYMHEIEKQLDDMLKSLNLVIIVLIISAGMLAFVVLYNLNNINITERQRELATLKVLGFYHLEVGAYVYRENILLTLLGAAAGVGLGKVLHLFIIETVEVDAAMFGRNINLPSYIYSLLFTIAFSLIVNGVMYFKLKRINMVESLKSIE